MLLFYLRDQRFVGYFYTIRASSWVSTEAAHQFGCASPQVVDVRVRSHAGRAACDTSDDLCRRPTCRNLLF